MRGCRIFLRIYLKQEEVSILTPETASSGHDTVDLAVRRDSLCPCPSAGLRRRLVAQSIRRAGTSRAPVGRCNLGRRTRRAAPSRRDPLLRPLARRAAVARLGNVALRHAVAAPGSRLRAPRDAVSAKPAALRDRRAGRFGHQRAVSAVARAVRRRPYVLLQAGPDDRRRAAACATGVRRLSARVAGGRAGRVCDSRRIDRSVSDGLCAAVSARPVRRSARLDPCVRSGHAARAVSGARSALAAGPRISDRRSSSAGISPALARAHRRRPESLERLQRYRHRHRLGRYRVLPALVLRSDRHAVRLFAADQRARAAWADRSGDGAFLERDQRALSIPVARCHATDSAAG